MKKTGFRALLCGLLVLMLALGCSLAQAEEPPKNKKVTVMVYMCGADLEVLGSGTGTISQMYSTRFNQDDVNVIVLCGGTRKWVSKLDASVLSVVDVGKGGRRSLYVAQQLPLASMGQPETLTNFLKLCYENYPADSYELVLWDHGGGPVGGVCWDQKFNEDQLTTLEVAEALAASPFADRGIDLLAMHACLMGSAEFAYKLSPYVKYYVASEDSQFGLDYSWIAGVENEAPLEAAKRIVDGSYASNTQSIEKQNASETNSFAVIDMTQMQALRDALDDFFGDVSAHMDDAEALTRMSGHRRDSQAFGLGESGGDSDFDLVDLGDLVNHYREFAPEKAKAVEDAMGNTVVYQQRVNEKCSGLTLYHPYRNKSKLEKRVEIYESLGFSENYTEYVKKFADYLMKQSAADWVNLSTETPAANKDVRTMFILPLTAEQAEQYGEGSLKVLLKDDQDAYTLTYMSRGVSLVDQTVTGEYVKNALFATAQDGTKLTEAIGYTVDRNGRWLIPATLTKKATEETDEAVHDALILCTYDKDTRKLIPGAVQVRDAGTGGYTSAYGTTLADYDEIQIAFVSRRETRNAQGTLLPFDAWEEAESRTWTYALDGSWDFELVPEALEDTKLHVTFEILDSQNNLYSSDLAAVAREEKDIIAGIDYDDMNLLLLAKPSISMLGDQLMFSASITNLAEEERIIVLNNLTINGTPLSNTAEANGNGDNWGLLPGEEQPLTLWVNRADLPEGILTEMTFDLQSQNAATGETAGTVPVKIGLSLDPLNP